MKALFLGGSRDGRAVESDSHAYVISAVDDGLYHLKVLYGSEGRDYWFYVHEELGEEWIETLIEGYRNPLPAKGNVEVPYGR